MTGDALGKLHLSGKTYHDLEVGMQGVPGLQAEGSLSEADTHMMASGNSLWTEETRRSQGG